MNRKKDTSHNPSIAFKPIAEAIANSLADELEVQGKLHPKRDSFINKQIALYTEAFEESFLQLQENFSKAGTLLKEEIGLLSTVEKECYEEEFSSSFLKIMQLINNPKSQELPTDLLEANTFQEFLGLSNEVLIWIYQTGYHFLQQKKHENAYCLFLFLTQMNALIPDYWIAKAFCEKSLQKPVEALHSFSIASLLNPDSPVARYNSAEIYLELCQFDDALSELAVLEKIIKKKNIQQLQPAINLLKSKIMVKSS